MSLIKPAVSKLKVALICSLSFFLLVWVAAVINNYSSGYFYYLGIQPRELSSVWHIVTAPFLHASFAHLLSNTVPGVLFAFLVAWSGYRTFFEVTGIAMVVGGLGVWLFGGADSNHVGASGLIYGWLAYLIVRGIFNRSWRQFLVGVFLASTYSGLIWGVFPGQPDISWQGHLFGALAGILAASVITSDDPAKPSPKPTKSPQNNQVIAPSQYRYPYE